MTAPDICPECSTRTVRLCHDGIHRCTRCEWTPDVPDAAPETASDWLQTARRAISDAITRKTSIPTPGDTP